MASPILFSERLNLVDVASLSPDTVRFGHITFSSDRYICCKTVDANSKKILKVIDLFSATNNHGNYNIEQFPMNGESAIMCPSDSKKWLALRGGNSLQVFDAAKREKVASQKFAAHSNVNTAEANDEESEIVFWTWVSEDEIGIVTKASVFHWEVLSNAIKKVFDVHSTIDSSCQIISYKVSKDKKWMVLTGIAKGEAPGTVVGKSQLFSVEKQVSQPLQSHAGTFANVTKEGETVERNLFCFVEKKDNLPPKLFIMEVGRDASDPSGVMKLPPQIITYPEGAASNTALSDFPVAMVFSEGQGLIYLITKMGYLFIFDVFTAVTVFSAKVTSDTVFATALDSQTKGVLGITVKKGSVLSLSLNPDKVIPYLLGDPDKNSLAISLAKRLNLPGAEEIFLHAFAKALHNENASEAAKIAATAPNGVLRTRETIDSLKRIAHGNSQVLLEYFKTVIEKQALNKTETIELAKLVLGQKKVKSLEKMIKEGKVYLCEELGDMLLYYKTISTQSQEVSKSESEEIVKLAMYVFAKTDNASGSNSIQQKVVECFVDLGEFEKILPYSKKVGFQPDFNLILQNVLKANPKTGEKFARELANNPEGSLIDINLAVEMFLQYGLVQEATSFLIDILKNDLPEDAALQTKLIEMNLINDNFNVVEAIFSNEMFHHFDRKYIANLLEKHRHFKRALQLYADLEDTKRVVGKFTKQLYETSGEKKVDIKSDEDFIVGFVSRSSESNFYIFLETILKTYDDTQQGNCLKLVVRICSESVEKHDVDSILDFLEKNSNLEAVFFFTSHLVNSTKSRNVVVKFIESGCKLKQYDAIIRVIKDNDVVAAVKDRLRNFFLLENFEDPRPYIHLCDRFGLVAELTTYLVNKDLIRHLEIYVEKVNPKSASIVIERMIELDLPETLIIKILSYDSVRRMVDYEALVEILEKRNKLLLIQTLLEDKVYKEKSSDEVVHNALAKLYIITDPEQGGRKFLETDKFYNPIVIGSYCEHLDPKLALACYKMAIASGKSSNLGVEKMLINLCLNNDLFQELAVFCLNRGDKELWDLILMHKSDAPSEEMKFDMESKMKFLGVVTSSSILNSAAISPISLTALIKSLLSSDYPEILITLLEQVLLVNNAPELKSTSLQNLLLLTAVKVKPEKVMAYIKDDRLDNFDAEAIAKQCLNANKKMVDEAVAIYKKFGRYKDAVEAMLEQGDITKVEEAVDEWFGFDESKGEEDADKRKQVISVLAKKFLIQGELEPAIKYYVEAENADDYVDVIKKAMELKAFSNLIAYLLMCRRTVREKSLDSTLVYCYCKTGQKKKLEEFLLLPNLAQINLIADRLLKESQEKSQLEFCTVLFSSENNYVKLAEVYLLMKDYKNAVEAAKKANQIDTWKSVATACIINDQAELAEIAALNVVSNPQLLDEIVSIFEERGKYGPLITLLNRATIIDHPHNGIFTHLALAIIRYSEYVPNACKDVQLLDIVKKHLKRLNFAKVTKACEEMKRYNDLLEIYNLNKDLEKSISVMLAYPEQTFSHANLVKLLKEQDEQKCIRNQEVYEKLVDFYIASSPLGLSDMLLALHKSHVAGKSPVLDCKRILLKLGDQIPLLQDFLINIQASIIEGQNKTSSPSKPLRSFESNSVAAKTGPQYDMACVNEALNELFLESEDFVALRKSIDAHSNFDHLALANKLKTHAHVEFRKIASKLYMMKKQFALALEICEADSQYEECLFYAKASKNKSICSDLLQKFSNKNNKEYFIALIVSCEDLVEPDIVLEIGWQKGWSDAIMPFMISHMRRTQNRIEELENQMGEIQSERKSTREATRAQSSLLANGLSGGFMLTN